MARSRSFTAKEVYRGAFQSDYQMLRSMTARTDACAAPSRITDHFLCLLQLSTYLATVCKLPPAIYTSTRLYTYKQYGSWLPTFILAPLPKETLHAKLCCCCCCCCWLDIEIICPYICTYYWQSAAMFGDETTTAQKFKEYGLENLHPDSWNIFFTVNPYLQNSWVSWPSTFAAVTSQWSSM